jgi:MoaA/NifB/PqqE/SkfB family radical SAM enzyme
MVFDPLGKVRACCVNFNYPLGDISKERLDDIWNGERISRLRQALMEYDLQFGCHYCERKLSTGTFQKQFVDAATLMTSKFERFDIEFEAPYWPKHLEFHLSNRCNLECVMCTGNFSSGIRKKREQLPPLPMAYDDQFFDDLQKYLPHLKMTQYLGGEPFIIPEMYRIWDMLIDQKLRPHCHITTNGTVWGPKVERVLESLPVAVAVSMDGITTETFEKIRINAKFERVVENLRRFRDHRAKYHFETTINFTMSRMNWHELPDMLLFAEDEGVKLHVLDLYFPESMSLYTLPASNLSQVIEQLERSVNQLSNRLRLNARVLETKLFELRHRLDTMNLDSLRVPDSEPPRESTVPTNKSACLTDEPIIDIELPEIRKEMELPSELDVLTTPPLYALDAVHVDTVISEPKVNAESPVEDAPEYYSWHVFSDVSPVSSRLDAVTKIRQWAPNSPVETLECNRLDEVTRMISSHGGLLHGMENVIGTTIQEMIWIFAIRLGNTFELIDQNDDPKDYFRTVKFHCPERGSTLVRSNMVPRYSEDFGLDGTTVVIGHRSIDSGELEQ